jgi:hypothetical protein
VQLAKQANVDGWKTKNGFDILNKKENYNLHPKKPAQSKADELTIPYHWQATVTKEHIADKVYDPKENDGKPNF